MLSSEPLRIFMYIFMIIFYLFSLEIWMIVLKTIRPDCIDCILLDLELAIECATVTPAVNNTIVAAVQCGDLGDYD